MVAADPGIRHTGPVVQQARGLLSGVESAGGATAFRRFDDGCNGRLCCERRAERGLLVVPGEGADRPGPIRIGFAALAQDFDEARAILRAGLGLAR